MTLEDQGDIYDMLGRLSGLQIPSIIRVSSKYHSHEDLRDNYDALRVRDQLLFEPGRPSGLQMDMRVLKI